MSFSTVCDAEAAGRLKGTGRTGKASSGSDQELFWSPDSFSFDNKVDAIDKSAWDAAVPANGLYYIGVIEEFDSNDTEPTYYESPNGNYREKTTNAKRIRQYRLIECSCTHAALLSFDGQNGRLFIRTSKGFLKARIESDGTVKGFKTTQFNVGLRTAATVDTPAFTPIDVTFATPVDDDKDIFEDSIDFEFSQVDQIFNAELSGASGASDGTNFTFNLTATTGCTDTPLTGALRANFKFTNINGTVLSTATTTEVGTTGVYAVDITTDETTILYSIDGIQTVASVNYVSGEEQISAA